MKSNYILGRTVGEPDNIFTDGKRFTRAKLVLWGMIATDVELSASDRLIAWFILDHFNVRRRISFPSHNRLSGLAGISVRQSKRCVQNIVRREWIFITKGGGRCPGGGGYANTYRPNWSKLDDNEDQTVTPVSPLTGDDSDTRVTFETGKGDKSGAETVTPESPQPLDNNHYIDSSYSPVDVGDDDEFDKFYNKQCAHWNIDKMSARAEYDRWREKGVSAKNMLAGAMRPLFGCLPKTQDDTGGTT
jgi:hypothetical protein